MKTKDYKPQHENHRYSRPAYSSDTKATRKRIDDTLAGRETKKEKPSRLAKAWPLCEFTRMLKKKHNDLSGSKGRYPKIF